MDVADSARRSSIALGNIPIRITVTAPDTETESTAVINEVTALSNTSVHPRGSLLSALSSRSAESTKSKSLQSLESSSESSQPSVSSSFTNFRDGYKDYKLMDQME
ncbi:hypothetical protein BaRGS_00023305 [Batillaria attramentaria]|uniref:Uncharacterized protein n=1 Tax=Batillaria attramentaria TaxID=370345 RepID=A0ABD0KEV4_9CAEN